ncbi:MAG: hypothetical protein AB2L22_12865 [Syntrophales bacterium]
MEYFLEDRKRERGCEAEGRGPMDPLSRSNEKVKRRMAEELLRLGFSRLAVERLIHWQPKD